MIGRSTRILVAAGLVVVLAGCGGDDEAAPGPEAQPTTTVATLGRTEHRVEPYDNTRDRVTVYHGIPTIRGSCDLVIESVLNHSFLVCPTGEPLPGSPVPTG